MYNRNQKYVVSSIENEIALAEQHYREGEASIINWYQVRRHQILAELDTLENAYNERMGEQVVEWTHKLARLEQQREQDSIIPIPQLTHQTNLDPAHLNIPPDVCGQEMIDDDPRFPPIPRLDRQKNVMYLSQEDRDAFNDFDYRILPVAPTHVDKDADEDADADEDEDEDADEWSDYINAEPRNAVAIESDDEGEREYLVSAGEEMC